MPPVPVEPLPLYRPRDPQASDLWRLLDRHFPAFQQVYDERFQAKYGFWRPVVERSVTAFLQCGDLHHGFARVRCPDCHHEMFVAFSCKQRCTCPSCHQKRALLTAIHVAEDVCAAVAHRQVVFTIPKRLRLHTRFDRKLLGRLSSCAWTCMQAEVRRLLGRDDVQPGMVVAIQTHGELLHWHPHIHALVTCGASTPQGDFLEVRRIRSGPVARGLAGSRVCPVPGRGQDRAGSRREHAHLAAQWFQRRSVGIACPPGDRAGIERLMQYMTRCPFSLSRLVKVTETGQVVYKAEKDACRAFPDPQGDGLTTGPKRNFQILSPLDFLAEFTQHIPSKGMHLIRYYGWYSNKARGLRQKAAEPRPALSSAARPPPPTPSRASQTWAMLIKKIFEVDPLACPECGSQMKVVAFIEPPQGRRDREDLEALRAVAIRRHPGHRPGTAASTTQMAIRTARRRLPTSLGN